MARPVAVDRGVLLATYVVLFAIGVISAVIESFLIPQRVGGHLGLSIVLAVVGNALLAGLGGFGTRTRAGAAIPLLGWFVVVGLLLSTGPGGDVILPGALPPDPTVPTLTIVFAVVGVFVGGLGVLATAHYTGRVNQPTEGQ